MSTVRADWMRRTAGACHVRTDAQALHGTLRRRQYFVGKGTLGPRSIWLLTLPHHPETHTNPPTPHKPGAYHTVVLSPLPTDRCDRGQLQCPGEQDIHLPGLLRGGAGGGAGARWGRGRGLGLARGCRPCEVHDVGGCSAGGLGPSSWRVGSRPTTRTLLQYTCSTPAPPPLSIPYPSSTSRCRPGPRRSLPHARSWSGRTTSSCPPSWSRAS